MKTLLIAPLKAELEIIKSRMESRGFEFHQLEMKVGRVYKHPSKEIYMMVGGVGDKKLCEKLSRFLDENFDVKQVVCAGTAASLSGDVSASDVVLRNPLRAVSKSYKWKVIEGEIFCSDEVLTSREQVALIQMSQPEALAYVMEGAKASDLCETRGISYTELRVITDRGDAHHERDFFANIDRSMGQLAEVIWDQIMV